MRRRHHLCSSGRVKTTARGPGWQGDACDLTTAVCDKWGLLPLHWELKKSLSTLLGVSVQRITHSQPFTPCLRPLLVPLLLVPQLMCTLARTPTSSERSRPLPGLGLSTPGLSCISMSGFALGSATCQHASSCVCHGTSTPVCAAVYEACLSVKGVSA